MQKPWSGRDQDRLVVLETDLARQQAKHRGQTVDRRRLGLDLRQAGSVEFGERRAAGPLAHTNADRADGFFQGDDRIAFAVDGGRPQIGQENGRTHGRMAGKRQLALWREDADAR